MSTKEKMLQNQDIVIFHIVWRMEPNFLRLNHLYLLSKFEFGSNCHYWPLRVIKTLTPLCAASAHVRSSGEPLPLQVLTMKLEHFSLLCMCCLCSVYQIPTYLFISDMLYFSHVFFLQNIKYIVPKKTWFRVSTG